MPLSNKPSAYRDVERAFQAAVEHGGGRLEFTLYGKAVHFRQRAYKYRNLINNPEYDAMTIRLTKTIEGGGILEFNPTTIEATFFAPDGTEKELPDYVEPPVNGGNHLDGFDPDPVDDDLLSDAQDLVRKRTQS